jgi:hypothetical protein
MAAVSVPDPDATLDAQRSVDLPSRFTRQPGASGAGPGITPRLRTEQRARGDGRLQRVLIETEVQLLPDVLVHAGGEPVGEAAGDVGEPLSSLVWRTRASRATAPGVVGRRHRDSLLRRAGEQGSFPSPRVPGHGDAR